VGFQQFIFPNGGRLARLCRASTEDSGGAAAASAFRTGFQAFRILEKQISQGTEDLAEHVDVHDNLALEVYDLAAKEYLGPALPSPTFTPADEALSEAGFFTDESWETITSDVLVYEAAAFLRQILTRKQDLRRQVKKDLALSTSLRMY
jgi:hypothetical protein